MPSHVKEIQLIGPREGEAWAMQVSELANNSFEFRFARYSRNQRKLTVMKGTNGFVTGTLAAGSSYSY